MTSPTRERRTERRAALGKRLLEAVEELADQGVRFNDASVEKLASQAGVSRATFYIYYEDKADFLRQATRDVFIELDTASRIWWDVAHLGNKRDIEASMTAIVRTYLRHRAVLAAVSEAAATDPRASQNYLEVMGNVIGAVQQAIDRGRSSGVIRDVPPTTAAALTWMVERSCTQVLENPPPGAEQDLIASFTEIMYSALYTPSTQRGAKPK